MATIEIAGTAVGDWGWAAVAPWSHLPSANPPSSIAAGYAVIDGSVALLALLAAVAIARVWPPSANCACRLNAPANSSRAVPRESSAASATYVPDISATSAAADSGENTTFG